MITSCRFFECEGAQYGLAVIGTQELGADQTERTASELAHAICAAKVIPSAPVAEPDTIS
jgi:hypothetical protein